MSNWKTYLARFFFFYFTCLVLHFILFTLIFALHRFQVLLEFDIMVFFWTNLVILYGFDHCVKRVKYFQFFYIFLNMFKRSSITLSKLYNGTMSVNTSATSFSSNGIQSHFLVLVAPNKIGAKKKKNSTYTSTT